MAKFDAATAVEDLEWDFTRYGGEADKGVIIEPSTGKVNAFFGQMKGLMKEVTAMQGKFKDLDNIEDLDDETLTDRVGDLDEAESGAREYQAKSIQYIAELCGATREFQINPEDPDGDKIEVVVGGSPSMEQLELLPYRVLTAFTQWLMSEIRPKKEAPAGKR